MSKTGATDGCQNLTANVPTYCLKHFDLFGTIGAGESGTPLFPSLDS
jgi:hypothetical protein